MDKKCKIVLVGGGSVYWSPKLINDLLLTPGLENAEYEILDINPAAGRKMLVFGEKYNKLRGTKCTFHFTEDQKEAFMGADFVIITISTGDLDAMEHDLKIPEEYKIYQTVGDTVGPGGWARSLRNIPVFVEMAQNIERYAPNAVVLNYTNPMAVLTNVFYKVSKLKTVGLCHGLFEVYDVLKDIFKLDSENDIKVNFGGINHFFWIIDFNIKGENGYELLKKRLGKGSLAELIKETYKDKNGSEMNSYVCSELYERFGLLTYNEDRHTCEFISCYLSGSEDIIEKYHLVRTFIEDRRKSRKEADELLDKYISGAETLSGERSRETAADIIAAFHNDKNFIDIVNLPNIGQIPNLPKDSIVETLGVVNSLGFKPICTGNLPEAVNKMVLPHAINQDLIVEAGIDGDLGKALTALYNDPLCAHLTYPEIEEMAMKLLRANKKFLPQFKLDD
jgi:alpha-galactosidase